MFWLSSRFILLVIHWNPSRAMDEYGNTLFSTNTLNLQRTHYLTLIFRALGFCLM